MSLRPSRPVPAARIFSSPERAVGQEEFYQPIEVSCLGRPFKNREGKAQENVKADAYCKYVRV
jgi:hypothetical protein